MPGGLVAARKRTGSREAQAQGVRKRIPRGCLPAAHPSVLRRSLVSHPHCSLISRLRRDHAQPLQTDWEEQEGSSSEDEVRLACCLLPLFAVEP
jgi:hypothetical protein